MVHYPSSLRFDRSLTYILPPPLLIQPLRSSSPRVRSWPTSPICGPGAPRSPSRTGSCGTWALSRPPSRVLLTPLPRLHLTPLPPRSRRAARGRLHHHPPLPVASLPSPPPGTRPRLRRVNPSGRGWREMTAPPPLHHPQLPRLQHPPLLRLACSSSRPQRPCSSGGSSRRLVENSWRRRSGASACAPLPRSHGHAAAPSSSPTLRWSSQASGTPR